MSRTSLTDAEAIIRDLDLHPGCKPSHDRVRDWIRRAAALNALMADQLQARAYSDKDYAMALELLYGWLGKFSVENRWPCGECGRPSPDAPLRELHVRVDGWMSIMTGCAWCNAYELVERTRAFLESM